MCLLHSSCVWRREYIVGGGGERTRAEGHCWTSYQELVFSDLSVALPTRNNMSALLDSIPAAHDWSCDPFLKDNPFA